MSDRWFQSDSGNKWFRSSDDKVSGDTFLWRYMDLPKFLWLLEHKQLYFSSVPDLWSNDPYEGVEFPRSTERKIAEAIRAKQGPDSHTGPSSPLPLSSSNLVEDLARQMYVSAWHTNDYHSAAMWKLYAGQKGVAIKTTLGSLLDSLDITLNATYFAAPLIYMDFDRETDEQGEKDARLFIDPTSSPKNPERKIIESSTLLYRRKRQEFAFEKEYRLFISWVEDTPDICTAEFFKRVGFLKQLAESSKSWAVGAREILKILEGRQPQHQEKLSSDIADTRRIAVDALRRDDVKVKEFLDTLADLLIPTKCKPKEPKRGLALPILSLEQLIKEVHIDPYGQNPELLKEVVSSCLAKHCLKEIPVCLRQDHKSMPADVGKLHERGLGHCLTDAGE